MYVHVLLARHEHHTQCENGNEHSNKMITVAHDMISRTKSSEHRKYTCPRTRTKLRWCGNKPTTAIAVPLCVLTWAPTIGGASPEFATNPAAYTRLRAQLDTDKQKQHNSRRNCRNRKESIRHSPTATPIAPPTRSMIQTQVGCPTSARTRFVVNVQTLNSYGLEVLMCGGMNRNQNIVTQMY